MLPLATAAAAKYRARRFLPDGRGLDHFQKLSLGVILFLFGDPDSNDVAGGGVGNEDHAAGFVAGYTCAAPGKVLDFEGELGHGGVMLVRSVEVKCEGAVRSKPSAKREHRHLDVSGSRVP